MDPRDDDPAFPAWQVLREHQPLLDQLAEDHPELWTALVAAGLEAREHRDRFAPNPSQVSIQPYPIVGPDAATQTILATREMGTQAQGRPTKDAHTQVAIITAVWTPNAATQTPPPPSLCHRATQTELLVAPERPSASTMETPPTSPPAQRRSTAYGALQPDTRRGCWNCGSSGHNRTNCHRPLLRRVCFRCGEPGVKVNECPKCAENWHPDQILPSRAERRTATEPRHAYLHPYEEYRGREENPSYRPLARGRGRPF